jgi:hypothetical protein
MKQIILAQSAFMNAMLYGNAEDHPLNSYLIIQRRIVWLIGRWVSQDCYPPTDPRIWQILLHLLTAKGTGTEVVRLTTATALQQCVDVSIGTDSSLHPQ